MRNSEPDSPGFLPDFIIIGAMKSATSAIYEYLMQHPLVARRMPKELHFFTLNYEKGLDWYISQFQEVKQQPKNQDLLIGEASPSYFPSQVAPSLIYQSCPGVKIILSLRNPTERAISHYYHQVHRVKDETRSIDLAFSCQEIADLEKKPYTKTSSYIQLGKYLNQVQHWLNIFPREQILVLNYHDLENSPDTFIQQVFEFLNLPECSIKIDKIYANQYPPVSIEIKERLNNYFVPYNKQLLESLGINLNCNQILL